MASETSASAVLSAMADRAEEIMHQQRQTTSTGLLCLPTKVEGRVFRRLHLFAQLPPELKAQADAVAVHLGSPHVVASLFSSHHWFFRGRRPRGPIVRGHALVAEILKYLVDSRAANASDGTATQLAETLVLSGFLSPVKEPTHEPLDLEADDELPPRTYIRPHAYYELVSSAVLRAIQRHHAPTRYQPEMERLEGKPENETLAVSVWDVVDGATRAGQIYRKQPSSLLLSLCCVASPVVGHETQHYVVVNRVHHKAVFVFRDDVARKAIARVPLRDALVSYEQGPRESLMYHGLHLWTDEASERFDFMATRDQHEWLLSFLDGGAKYKEVHGEVALVIRSPFYGQRDVLASGEQITMGELTRGKVVVVVNVASHDPEAAVQYPELVALWEKYHNDGLEILACPSDQFLGLEFANDHEIIDHVARAYHVRFPVLAKRDVNGPHARAPFLYLNAHLPGVFGPFTEWNFTKFVLDRSGKPVRRVETRVLPMEMEGMLRWLLGHDRHRSSSSRSGRKTPMPEGSEQVERELQPERVANEITQETRSCPRAGCETVDCDSHDS